MTSKKSILVAEDDASMARLISYKLNTAGYEVEIAEDGGKVLGQISKNDYNALVLDLMLPVLSGEQVLKKLREKSFDIPVLILSAKSQEKDILSSLRSGADEYMTKPFKPDELLLRLKKMLES